MMLEEEKKNSILNILYEWAVWGHLYSRKDLELILLKGHLIIENTLEACLTKKVGKKIKDFSFYRKVKLFEEMIFENRMKHNFIVERLIELNRFRNELAHEPLFEFDKSNIITWSDKIHKELRGKKYSKYTIRTRFIHTFSFLAINILEMDNLKYKMNSQ